MRAKYTAKWGLQISEMVFQTRSGAKKAVKAGSSPVSQPFSNAYPL
ncbi:DUF6783 domain-containing protein [Fusicatenibacter sp.]